MKRFMSMLVLVAGVFGVGACSHSDSCDACCDGCSESSTNTVNLVAGLSALKHGDTARFKATNDIVVKVPEGARSLRVWVATPLEGEAAQEIVSFTVDCPHPHRLVSDNEGNRQIFVELQNPAPGEFKITSTFDIRRHAVLADWNATLDRPMSAAERAALAKYLEPNANVVIDDEIKALSRRIVGDEKRPVVAARRIYDWVLENIDYWVKDPANKKASPVGSTSYCLANKTGNCTDFHSLWTSLARAAGIPTRMKYGSFFKAELDGQDADQSYHCWPEFWAPGIGWVPHDVAVADIFVDTFPVGDANAKLVRLTTADGYRGPDANLVNWYFGNLDNRRVTWSIGRDLVLDPPAASGPVNALPKAWVEVDGKPGAEKEVWTRKLTYSESK